MEKPEQRPSMAAGSRAVREAREPSAPWFFLSPHLMLFASFILIPICAVFALSLYDWNLLGDHRFVGLANFAEILGDREFWRALGNTLLYGIAIVPLVLAMGLGCALALNRDLPGRGIFRAVIYLPSVLSSVASATIAAWIFNDQYGVLNNLLGAMGMHGVPWLSSTRFAMPAVILTTVWIRTGLCMVIYLAALQDVPRELIEAARLDGASSWNVFRWVTLPMLRPTTTFLLVTNVIYSIHVFDLIYVMTDGGPAFSTTVLVQYLYESAFEEQRQGYAAALSVVLLVVLLLLTSGLLLNKPDTRRQLRRA